MKDLIQDKLQRYNSQTEEDEENALKEITQEVALFAFAEAGFFEHAVFQGGTCLRIIHGLDRFSEDLDFALRSPQDSFDLGKYLSEVAKTMSHYGYSIEVAGQDKADQKIKSRFLKDDSIKKLLKFEHKQDTRKIIQVKIEVDVNPPAGDGVEPNYLNFPTQCMIMTHDMPSLLSGKIHALLCRSYTKGRDWYDYIWYAGLGTGVNYKMLNHSLKQQGPWKDLNVQVDKTWLHNALREKIKSIVWSDAAKDVERFLKPDKKRTIKLWSEDFFVKMTDKILKDIK